jgi:hypothetical protein
VSAVLIFFNLLLTRLTLSLQHQVVGVFEHPVKPHKISYYLEKRDPHFDRKMHEVLMVYSDVSPVVFRWKQFDLGTA